MNGYRFNSNGCVRAWAIVDKKTREIAQPSSFSEDWKNDLLIIFPTRALARKHKLSSESVVEVILKGDIAP